MTDLTVAQALDELRKATDAAEQALADRQAGGASLQDAFADAGAVYTARKAQRRAEAALAPDAAAEAGAAALAQAFGIAHSTDTDNN